MSATQDAWKDVASKAESIGLKLKFHMDQENDDTSDRQPGDTDKAMSDFSQRLQDAFEGLGAAAKDPAVHADVKDMGTSMFNALSLTFNLVGDKARDIASKATNPTTEDGPADSTGTTEVVEIQDEVDEG